MWCPLRLLVPVVGAALFMGWPRTTALVVAAPPGVATALIASAGGGPLRRLVVTGADGLRGRRDAAVSHMSLDGLVRLAGELWRAEARRSVPKGQPAEVVEVSGARGRVRPWT
ncbi:MAG: NfeD family protein [Armatimonadota bacterium]|nr:NfeD family protein [Armatimonadota bacterium]